MLLGLSSAAAPDATLRELLDAAVRRGLSALELRDGDAHGVVPGDGGASARAAVERAVAAKVTLSGYRSARVAHDLALARLSYALGAPVILDGPDDVATRIDRAKQMVAAGGDVAVVLRGDPVADDAALIAAAGLALAWEANPTFGPLGTTAEALLQQYPGELRHIRLIGGGPETEMQHGKGIGELMRQLALAGYGGTFILAPSTPGYRVAWRNWLGHRRGWGCGSKTTESLPVHLSDQATTGGKP
jgi:hypothetical protein